MPYAQPFIRITVGGTLASGNEIWSSGFHVGDFSTGTDPEDFFAQVTTDNLPFFANVYTMVSTESFRVPTGVQSEYVKAALIDVNGLTIGEPYIYSSAPDQGSAAVAYVPQAAMVTTLVADKFRDPGKYNRFYLPVTPPLGDGSYAFQGASQTNYLNDMVTLFDILNENLADTTGPADPQIAVISGTREGSQLPVVSVRVGQVIDTQQRRRNNLPENYLTAPLDA